MPLLWYGNDRFCYLMFVLWIHVCNSMHNMLAFLSCYRKCVGVRVSMLCNRSVQSLNTSLRCYMFYCVTHYLQSGSCDILNSERTECKWHSSSLGYCEMATGLTTENQPYLFINKFNDNQKAQWSTSFNKNYYTDATNYSLPVYRYLCSTHDKFTRDVLHKTNEHRLSYDHFFDKTIEKQYRQVLLNIKVMTPLNRCLLSMPQWQACTGAW